MNIRRLSDLDLGRGPAKPLKVCVVSSEFLGPVRNGGIATATSALAHHLASDGHEVTLLYTLVEGGKPTNIAERADKGHAARSWEDWVKTLAADGIALHHIEHEGSYESWREKSWLVKEFIGQKEFDLVYYDDFQGAAYYSVLAKRAGIAPFASALHCIITHGTMQWICAVNDQYMRGPTDVERFGMERRGVELADVVIGPSRYLLGEYAKYGWRLPVDTFQQPYPLIRDNITSGDDLHQIDELVFFGRLEVRKGLWLFCAALDRLADRLRGKTVTFLGKLTDNGISSGFQIVNRSASWPFRVKLLTTYDRDQALGYLKSGRRLAVMPSLADNSPCVVYECMEAGIPFVTTRGSGADELVDPSCFDDMLVEPKVELLTERLAQILDKGAKLGHTGFDAAKNLATWSAWHRYVSRSSPTRQAAAPAQPDVATFGSADRTPLLVLIDDRTTPLGVLVENLASHAKRLGTRANYVVLSDRMTVLRQILIDLLSGAGRPSIEVFGPKDVEEARTRIAGATFAFFMDGRTEMLTPFFVLALERIIRSSSVVTCVGAVRTSSASSGKINHLPLCDIPGLSAFGEAVGGPVWAFSPSNMAEEFAALELRDKHLCTFHSSAELGALFMERSRLSGRPPVLLPMVGAVTTRSDDGTDGPLSFEDTRQVLRAMDIAPTIYPGGVAAFAISEFAIPPPIEATAFSGFLPDHPLSQVGNGNRTENAGLAAALGRAELALQLASSRPGTVAQIRNLLDSAIESRRLRPSVDLLHLLQSAAPIGTEKSPRERVPALPPPEPSSDADLQAGQKPSEENVATFLDRRLSAAGARITSVSGLRDGGPGRLVFFDVPLRGNDQLRVRLRSAGRDPLLVRLRVIDQFSGLEMGAVSDRLAPKEVSELAVFLLQIYGSAAIVIEFSGASRMSVVAETITVQ